MCRLAFELLKDITQYSRHDTSFLPFLSSTHRVCFSTTSLSICKDCSIITFQTVVNNRFGHKLEYLFLVNFVIEYLFKTELVMVSSIWHTISGNIKTYYLLTLNLVRNSIESCIFYFCFWSEMGLIRAKT